MQHFKALKTISSILGLAFVLVTFGCDASRNTATNKAMGLAIHSVPEGICLTFDNIPALSTRLHITVMDIDGTHYPEFHGDNYYATLDIRGDLLEQIKQHGRIKFPFVQPGHKYAIWVSLFYDYVNDDGIFTISNIKPTSVHTEYIADNGNNFNFGIELSINQSKTGVTLSSEPVFPIEMQYNPNKYCYYVHILVEENGILTHYIDNDSPGGLHWEFGPELNIRIKEYPSYPPNGNYPTYITAISTIVYDNLTWEVEIAKTAVFTYSIY